MIGRNRIAQTDRRHSQTPLAIVHLDVDRVLARSRRSDQLPGSVRATEGGPRSRPIVSGINKVIISISKDINCKITLMAIGDSVCIMLYVITLPIQGPSA